MKCPVCPRGSDVQTRVVETRRNDDNTEIERRRECRAKARHRFSTVERYDTGIVLKEHQENERFDRGKLARSITLAINETKVKPIEVDELVSSIEQRIIKRGSLSAREIGELVLDRLEELDEVAFIRFASVFHEFQSASQFLEQIEHFESNRRRVVKRADGRRERFDKLKLAKGMQKAANGLASRELVDEAVERIDKSIKPGEDIDSRTLGDRALTELGQLSPVAFLRFASVFQNFESLDDFERAMARLREEEA